MFQRNNPQWRSFLIAGLFIVGGVSLHPVFSKTEETLSLQDVNTIISKIETAEKGIHNLKVDAESWIEERASTSDSWRRTPTYFSCTAWINGGPKGKIRVDVHKENLKWIDGVAPYFDRSYSVSFDGINTKSMEYTTGHSGKTFLKNEGRVSPGESEFLRSNIMGSCIGWRFTTNFFFNSEKESMSFSRSFRLATSPDALAAKAFEFGYEEKDGVLCLKFGSSPAKWGRKTWWFDPNRGFALIACLHTNKGKDDDIEHVVSDIRVNKLQEVATGVWWPMEATIESEICDPMLRDPNAPYKRTVYRALKVVANDPSFDDNVFTLTFPEGYRVNDKVTGKTYIVDANSK